MTSVGRARLLPFAIVFACFVALGAAALAMLLPRTGSQGAGGVGGPFSLITQDGAPVTQAVLDGHPTLVFFGYTHCPDICPATLAQISTLFKAMGPNETTRALFVTVDPARDTPAVLKDYLQSFDPRITALTGSPEDIRKIETAYKVYAKAVPDKDGTYSMDHTAMTYLMDKSGRFVGGFDLDRPAQAAADELKRYD